VTVDNCTTSSYTVVGVVCRDRKGLVYDLFRTLKDIHIRVAYAKVRAAAASWVLACARSAGGNGFAVLEGARVSRACGQHMPSIRGLRGNLARVMCQVCVRGDMAEADLFVEEADGQRAERCALACPASPPAAQGASTCASWLRLQGDEHGGTTYYYRLARSQIALPAQRRTWRSARPHYRAQGKLQNTVFRRSVCAI